MFRTVTPILSIVIALFVYFFFTQPLFEEISALRQEAAQYEEAVSRANEKNRLLNTLLATKNSFSEVDQQRLGALVPATVDEVRLLVDLNEIARLHNMLIGNIAVAKGSAAGGNNRAGTVQSGDQVDINSFTSSNITFGLIGTYDQFKNLLRDLERSLVLTEITDISFIPGEGALQQFSVTVRTFALPSIN